MNKDNAKDYLPLVQALADGKTIQCKQYSSGEWVDLRGGVNFDSTPFKSYRIKPEPIEMWMTITPTGKVRGTFLEQPENMLQGDRLALMREVIE